MLILTSIDSKIKYDKFFEDDFLVMFKFSSKPSLEQLRIDHVNFNYDKMKWGAYQTPRNLVLALFGEVGELLCDIKDEYKSFSSLASPQKPQLVHQKKRNNKNDVDHAEDNNKDSDIKYYELVLNELIDVFSYLICIAYECGVDIAKPEEGYKLGRNTFSDISWDELEVSSFYLVNLKSNASLARNLYKLVVAASNICDHIQWKIVEKKLENLQDKDKEQIDKVIKNIFCHIVAIASQYHLDVPRLLHEKNCLTSEKYSASIGVLSKENVFQERYSSLKVFRKKNSVVTRDFSINKPDSGLKESDNIHKLLCSLVSAAGLISEIFQWDEEVHHIILSDAKQAHLSKQLSNFVYCIVRIAQYYQLLLGTSFAKKMRKNILKYPVSLAANSAEKYNNLSTGEDPSNEGEPIIGDISTISAAADLMTSFTNDRNWSQFHTPRCLTIAMFGEVGEVVELFTESDCPNLESLQDELSDCLAYSLELAYVTEVDICGALHHYFPEA